MEVILSYYIEYRLYRLDDMDRNKIINRKFISMRFILSIGFISLIVLLITIGLLIIS
jgi:hypothetical protein